MSEPAPRRIRRWPWIALASIATVIAVVTLTPSYPLAPGEFTGCMFCGQRWLADLLRNVILFIPLGAALASVHRPASATRAMVIAALASALIEFAQVGIPGRDPSVSDLIANTLGGILGVGAVQTFRSWTAPPAPAAGLLAIGAALLFGSILAGTGKLWQPSLTKSVYWVEWTPVLEHLEPYHGRLVSASLDSIPLMPGDDPARVTIEAFLRGAPIDPPATSPRPASSEMRLQAIAGPPPGTVAPLFAIHDRLHREIILIGADRGDLVLRFRTRASALELDQPDIRARNALRDVRPGDRLTIQVRSAGRGLYCLGSDAQPSCTHGFSVGSGWAGLLFPRLRAAWAQRLLDGLWLAALAFPVGLWARRDALSAVAPGILVVSLWLIPELSGLHPVVPSEILSVLAGVGAGWRLRRRMSGSGTGATSA